jgi:hypothetical protein
MEIRSGRGLTEAGAEAGETAVGEARSGDDCGAVWIDGDLLFGSIAIAGALYAYYLYTVITMKGRRRKRRLAAASTPSILSRLRDLSSIGNYILPPSKKVLGESRSSVFLGWTACSCTISASGYGNRVHSSDRCLHLN